MPSSTITSKGQITLPIEVRRALRLRPGDRVSFRMAKDGSVVVEPETVDLLSLKGAVKSKVKGVSVEQMQQAIGKAVQRR
ncbi:MAG: type II toxin-antitoxin system PrlF family antitoxin [Myxococcales bacterium]|nr:type II toxin-antitoxin system PrlF family antitoxin [Myxococcales bacterium]